MLRDVTQVAMFSILEEEKLGYSWLKSESRLTLEQSGSEIIFRATEEYERLRGTNLAWFGVDELTYCHPQAWKRLEGRLRDEKAHRLCGFAVWTPKGFDWVYDKFISGKNAGYVAYLGSPGENRYLPSSFYPSLAGSYDERFYAQEVLGQYLNVMSGQAYYAFDRQLNVTAHALYNPRLPLCWSLDFNLDPMCSVIAQIDETPAQMAGHRSVKINFLDELFIRNSNTPEACEEFVRKAQVLTRGRQVHLYVYGDATGSQRQRAVGAGANSDWAVIRQFFAHQPDFKMSFRYKTANPAVRDRVAAVNGALCNSQGERRAFIHPKCTNLIRDFEQVVFKPGTGQLDQATDPKLTHISDAAGYLIEREMPVRQSSIGYQSTQLPV